MTERSNRDVGTGFCGCTARRAVRRETRQRPRKSGSRSAGTHFGPPAT